MSDQPDFTIDEIQEAISEQEDVTEFYDTDYRYILRQKGVPDTLVLTVVDNFLNALAADETYFDGGENAAPPYFEEVLTSPSLTKSHVQYIYEAFFKGFKGGPALESVIKENPDYFNEDQLIGSADEMIELVKRLYIARG
jgi:hypothetical protein